MTDRAPRDDNYFPYVFVSQGGSHVPTNIYVDETTHRLLVNAILSGGPMSGVVWDEAVGTSEDALGNPQVMTFKLAGNSVAVIDLTYNASDKLTHLLRAS